MLSYSTFVAENRRLSLNFQLQSDNVVKFAASACYKTALYTIQDYESSFRSSSLLTNLVAILQQQCNRFKFIFTPPHPAPILLSGAELVYVDS